VTQAGTHSDRARAAFLDALVHDDPVGLYESAPCGFLTTTPDGVIVKSNATFRTWVQRSTDELVGETTLADLLTVGSRIYYSTHVGPGLLMSDRVQEVALDLVRADGTNLSVLINASLARSDDGHPRAVRIAVFDATERRSYERELLAAKQRAEASELEAQELARTLQQTLIPPVPPTVPGLDLAAAYRPAGRGTEVGGDFYDVFRVGPDDWVITLGDVCGKGYEAALVTTLVRHTVRALCVGQDTPSEVLAALDQVLQQHPTDRFCTALLLRLVKNGPQWLITMSLAGHPQPVLLRPGGTAELVGTPGSVLGVVEDPTFADVQVRLACGDVLLLYTDGVTEGRQGKDFYGEQHMLATVNDAPRRPAGLIQALLNDVQDYQSGTLRDDIALLAFGPPT
jgi:sigma-B regulation protein RsbU (phosphoserine phosphatase)